MSAKSVLGGKGESEIYGTKTSGYTDTEVPKECGTCKYIQNGHLCSNKRVLKDKQVKTDKESGLKIVDPENGCCSFWYPYEEE